MTATAAISAAGTEPVLALAVVTVTVLALHTAVAVLLT